MGQSQMVTIGQVFIFKRRFAYRRCRHCLRLRFVRLIWRSALNYTTLILRLNFKTFSTQLLDTLNILYNLPLIVELQNFYNCAKFYLKPMFRWSLQSLINYLNSLEQKGKRTALRHLVSAQWGLAFFCCCSRSLLSTLSLVRIEYKVYVKLNRYLAIHRKNNTVFPCKDTKQV